MRSLTRVLGACVLAVTMTATGLAFGGDTSTAEHLFKQGLDAMKRNQFKEACDAFNGSNEADPSPGTEINLALCNEKQGKLATAWGWYRTAAGLADQRGQKERAELARAESVKLEPKLHKLVVTLKTPVEGVVVTRNGQPVPNATLGTDVPIDPGDYTIEVVAKGKKPWKQQVHIASTPGIDRIDVPTLEDAPVEVAPPPPGGAGPDYVPPAPTRDGTAQRNIGFVVGGAGIVAGIVAIAVEFLALREEDKAKEFAGNASAIQPIAPAKVLTSLQEVERKKQADASEKRHNAAKTNETIAIATGIGAVVCIGVGVALVLSAPSSKSSGSLTKPQVIPLLGRDTAGLGLVGRF